MAQRAAALSRKPTMKDVARLAGVSPMTVSRVLAQPGAVTEQTRARVERAVSQLGYTPDRIAGSLSSKRSGFIGAVLPTLVNPNFADTAHGLTQAIKKSGYQLLIGYSSYRLEEEDAVVGSMLARRPEAMVLTGGHHSRKTAQSLRTADIPIVETWDLPARPIGHVVGFSNVAVGRAITHHLIDRGHRRIAFLGPPDIEGFRDFRGEERLNGCLAELRAAGLPDDLIIRHGDGPVGISHGAGAISEVLALGWQTDAIVAVSDLSAAGAIMECQRRGICVPRDLAVAGFGDFEIAGQLVPSLTTVRVHCTDIGERTGSLLTRILGDPEELELEPQSIDLGFQIIERDSTAGA